ncbi:import receptor subunit TOM40 [Seminavis robusta]|uniref:Import receptor subunit TOM40 n=1 Tax=Seminavis robusta TaxID=568900 RepID=A0A9N8H922_9STRA|nr:import receptor subunit TOM40 [Seminavis robusta]|eukprot:Sro190_g081700.1 import receptor subunit TOM40 (394) ;mRNA; f:10937-12118
MGTAQSKVQEPQRKERLSANQEFHNQFRAFSSSRTFGPLLLSSTQCEQDAPPLPPLDGSSSEPPPPPPEETSIAEAARSASAFGNPGPYEMVAQESKRLITLDTYDGFRCDISKQLSPYMVAIHNFWLGTNMMQDGRKSTYAFVTQVADESGLLMARVDPGRGSVDGRVHRAILGGLAMGKLQLGLSTEGQQDQALAEIDFGGETWTANLKYGSMGGGIAFGCNYFQTVTPRLAMGGEGMFLGANKSLMSNYTLRYTLPAKTGEEDLPSSILPEASTAISTPPAGSSTFWASYNSMAGQASLSYKRVVTPDRVTLGAGLDFSPMSLESQVLLGAEFKLTRSKLNFCVDGSGHIQSTLETKLGMVQGAPTLCFSADVDHMKDEMRFGYGLNFEG